MTADNTVTVRLGEESVAIRRRGRSTTTVAHILGVDRDEAGEPVRVYLDRLVHRPHEDTLGEWRVEGAVSSILSRGAHLVGYAS